jgi:hypothetical protein
MLKNITCGFVLLSAMFLVNQAAIADDTPTMDQVYQAARAGRMDAAQGMMDKVLKQHPDSAKAHFVEAELLARQGRMGRAGEELDTAQRLKPDLSFARPEAVQELKNRIAVPIRAGQSPAAGYQAGPSGGFPWGMLLIGLGVIALIVFVIRALNARNPAVFPGSYQPGMQNGAVAPVPMQPYGGGMAPTGGGIGSGIMGGLATGAALGAGMVAGEALAHHFMDGGHGDANNAAPVADSWGNPSDDMGGKDFGIADNSSWSDNSSFADDGSGGGDWN